MPRRTSRQLTAKEQLVLDDTVLTPSNKSVRDLAHQHVQYLLLNKHSHRVLLTDRPRTQALNKALEESPDRAYIGIIKAQPGQSDPVPPLGSPQTQDERWRILELKRKFLEKEPVTFEDHFWRWTYSFSAALMLQELINSGVAGIKAGPSAAAKYMGQLWEEAMKQENPEAFAEAQQQYQLLMSTSSSRKRSNPQKSNYGLLYQILDSVEPSSPTSITPALAGQMVADKANLSLREFRACTSDENMCWKVKSIDSAPGRATFFWVQFSSAVGDAYSDEEISLALEEEDPDSQARVTENKLVGLLLRSDVL